MEPNDRSGLLSVGDEDVGLVLLGVEGRILEVCPNAERILGSNASVFRGQRIEEILGPSEPVNRNAEGEGRGDPAAKRPPVAPQDGKLRVEVRYLGDAPADSREAVLLVSGPRSEDGRSRNRVLGRLTVATPLMLFVLEPPARLVLWMPRTTAKEIGLDADSLGEEAGRFLARTLHPADVDTVLAQLLGKDLPDAVLPMPVSFRVLQKDGAWRAVKNHPALVWRRDSGQIRWIFGVVEDALPDLPRVGEDRSGRILGGVSEAANALLSLGDLAEAVPQALRAFVRSMEAEAATVWRFRKDEILRMPVAEAAWEWCAPATAVVSSVGLLQELPFDGKMGRWYSSLANGQEMSGVVGWLPEEQEREFEKRGVLSALAIPISVHSATWGCLELAEGRSRRIWDTADRDAARVLASHLGHAIGRAGADRRLRTLSRAVQQSPAAILIADARGSIEYVNPRFTEDTGWPAEEIVGEDPAFLASRQVAPRLFEQLLQVVRSGSEWRGELCHETPAGLQRWFDVSMSPVRDSTGRTTHFVVIEEDVSARRQVEETLRAGSERYRFLFDSVPALVWLTDSTGACLGVNRRWLEFTGWNEAAAAGDGWLLAVVPEDRGVVSSAVRTALEGLRPFRLECRLRANGGAAVWHLLTVEPVLGPKGVCEGLLGACVDIGAVKESERALLASREELRALTLRLVSVREEERRLLARELHDGVGQALTCLSLDLSSLDRSLGDRQPDLAKRLSVLAQEVVDALADVRDLARRIRPVALDVGLVAALEGELKAFGRRSGIAWELCASDELEIDPERSLALFRFVQEALTNVVRHAAARAVRVALAHEGGCLRLEVADDGRGVGPSLSGKGGGLGLVGLRERVAPWGGSIRLEPNDPAGTRAVAEIPFGGAVESEREVNP
jgi:PAS domain S-box-containing protein